jgi:hypothetical protein
MNKKSVIIAVRRLPRKTAQNEGSNSTNVRHVANNLLEENG